MSTKPKAPKSREKEPLSVKFGWMIRSLPASENFTEATDDGGERGKLPPSENFTGSKHVGADTRLITI